MRRGSGGPVDERPGGLLQLAERRAGRLGAAAYAFALCLVALALVGGVGLIVRQPYMFPSLGPTVMLFFESPVARSAAPRNAFVGHGVGIVAGYLALLAFGLTDHPSVLQEGLSGPRIAAASLSVAATVFVLRLVSCPHAPAGATTLIISLGLLGTLRDVLDIAIAVVLLTVLSVALNRVLGVRQPLWS